MKLSYKTDNSEKWTDIRDVFSFDFDAIDRELIVFKKDNTKLVIKDVIQFFSF